MATRSKKHKWNVLIFPGGTEVGLEIQRALRHCKEVTLFSASSGVSNHAPFVYETNHIISDVSGDTWLDELRSIVSSHEIDFIYPANSYVIDALVEKREQLPCPVILPDSEVVAITRSKRKTAALFADIFPTPRTYGNIEEVESYPVFLKPDNAYGAQGTRLATNREELVAVLESAPALLVQEYLPGREYSVDCFSTGSGELLFCQGRERARIRMGTTMGGFLAPRDINERLTGMAKAILSRLALRGGWFFQVKENAAGELCLLEIEARIAGTMALNRVRGVNFPLLSLYDFAGQKVSVSVNDYDVHIDRALINRFSHSIDFTVVYVDLDDTIIINNQLNTDVIRFLYQCINQQKKIVLISKSLEKDPIAYLRKWRINELFDEIHWLREDESKAAYITEPKSIFIDDSFAERHEVQAVHNIPTFDGSMIELLLSDKS